MQYTGTLEHGIKSIAYIFLQKKTRDIPLGTRINYLMCSNVTCLSMSQFVTMLTHLRSDYKIVNLTFKLELHVSRIIFFSTWNNEWNEWKQRYSIKNEKNQWDWKKCHLKFCYSASR